MSAKSEAVLVVEDEIIVGMDLAVSLEDAGFAVIGPYASCDEALAALDNGEKPVRAGVLDINLGEGVTSAPIASKLEELGVPFVFLSGYTAGRNKIFEQFPDAPRISKPCLPETLLHHIRALTASA
ncbi:MAG: response regulator [Oceanicaulis sp.]